MEQDEKQSKRKENMIPVLKKIWAPEQKKKSVTIHNSNSKLQNGHKQLCGVSPTLPTLCPCLWLYSNLP